MSSKAVRIVAFVLAGLLFFGAVFGAVTSIFF